MKKITDIRLNNHLLADSKFRTIKSVVAWFGAVQAQNFNMSKWAIGLRLSDITDKAVEEALNKGDIIRTHILRPTWHIVSSDDIYWMLALSAPRIKASMRSSDKEYDINNDIITKTNIIIEQILEKEDNLTRQELGIRLVEHNLNLENPGRLKHLLFHAELDGIVCNGTVKNKKQTYTLLEKKVPDKIYLNKEESLEKLARKYFSSHSPATLQDFIWWSGLAVGEAKLAMEFIKADFYAEEVDNLTYRFSNSSVFSQPDSNAYHLLPAFDEYIVGYKYRHHFLRSDMYKKVISHNGIFKPIIVKDGQVVGIWKREEKKSVVTIQPELFDESDKAIKSQLKKAITRFEEFNKN